MRMHPITQQCQMDDQAGDTRAIPNFPDPIPDEQFLETEEDRHGAMQLQQILPKLTSSLERRIAWMLLIDRVPVTISEFRELGIDRETLTKVIQLITKQRVTQTKH